MELKSARSCKDLYPVLATKTEALLQDGSTVYWVYSGITDSKWENMTVTRPQKLGKEFPKTFGHYHSQNFLETYKLVQGTGLFLLQKKFYESGIWIWNQLEAVYLVRPEIGEEIRITPEWGHAWINIGNEPLVTFDDWRSGHIPQDYEPIERLHGMGYYLTNENNEVRIDPNPEYKLLPPPKVITVKGFYQVTRQA